jgi:ABC-type iron transport system FetAB permease component
VGVTVPLCSGMWSILIVLVACLVNAWFIYKTKFRNVRSKGLRLTYSISHSLIQIGLLIVCLSDQLKLSASGVVMIGYTIIGCVGVNLILDIVFIAIEIVELLRKVYLRIKSLINKRKRIVNTHKASNDIGPINLRIRTIRFK